MGEKIISVKGIYKAQEKNANLKPWNSPCLRYIPLLWVVTLVEREEAGASFSEKKSLHSYDGKKKG